MLCSRVCISGEYSHLTSIETCAFYSKLLNCVGFQKMERFPDEGYNEELKEACRTLKEYRQYVDKVRAFAKDKSRGEAYEGNR